MAEFDRLKKKIEEQEKKEKGNIGTGYETVDMDKVEDIVSKMKRKYSSEGMDFEEVGGRMGELRGAITGAGPKVSVQRVEDLTEFQSPVIKRLGKFYLAFQGIFRPIANALNSLPQVKKLGFYLYSANMRLSVQQYLAIGLAASAIAAALIAILGVIWAGVMGFPALNIMAVGIGLALGVFMLGMVVVFILPKNKAEKRADELSVELPFALRHMATELKAGIGLYKTLQTIAVADYGVLSEEFARTISEVEEGLDTKDALRNFAARTESRALKMALMHVVRALKSGGNLSDIMGSIAEDVSFELRMKVRDFSEKMNFFGVIFIVGAIVFPVFVAIIGAIANAPFGFAGFSLPPQLIFLFFVVLMPFVLLWLVFYLKISQPKV